MGTDIYAYIEYESHGTYRAWAKPNLPRKHDVFATLALGDGGIQDNLLYPARGLPPGYSSTVAEAFFIDGDDARDLAEQVGIDLEIADYPAWAQLEYVETGCFPNPDWHTPSWLTLGELTEVLSQGGKGKGPVPPEYQAVVAAMQALADAHGHDRVRFVFWFD